MIKKHDKELKVGLFVTLGVALIMAAIAMLGGVQSLFTRQVTYTTHFASTQGLIVGSKVVMAGIPVGTVLDVDYDASGHNVKVNLSVQEKYSKHVREGSRIEIFTQGVLGDKYLSIDPGEDTAAAPLPEGAEIPAAAGKDLSQVLSKGDELMTSLTSIASSMDRLLKSFEKGGRSETFFKNVTETSKNMASATERLNQELQGMHLRKTTQSLNSILEKINSGSGTLGALVNDPTLYNDARSLVGGANRNRIMRNLVRKTIKDSEAQTESK